MPTPLPVVSFSIGIEWAKDDKEGTYLSLFQNVALKGNLLPKHVSTKFPRDIPIPYDYSYSSANDALIERVSTHCDLYFRSIKSKLNHSLNCKSKKSAKSSDKQSTQSMRKLRPQRIEAHHQKELLCAMTFQELEWHAIDDASIKRGSLQARI